MITWKLVVYCCTLSLLSNQVAEVGSQENTANAIFAIPASQMAQNLSMEFSNIITNNLGVDALTQAFQGSGIFTRRSLSDDGVRSQINRTNLQGLYSRIMLLFTEAFGQSDQQVDATDMFPQDLITECCSITEPTALRLCCHQCESQAEDVRNYLINVAEVFNNGFQQLFNDHDFGVQVRFEFGHQSGALLEIPAINIGAFGDCTTQSASMQDWYYSALNSSTDAVIESVRITEGGFSLSIAVASNGMVARALIKMTDLFSDLVEMLQRRPSSYWLVLNSQEEIFYHPQLPLGRSITIHQLERELGFRNVSIAMARLETGTVQITKTHLLSLGPTIMHGFTERSILSTYIYQPILMDTMVNLSICVILAEEDRISATIVPTNPRDIIGDDTRLEPFYHCSFATGATNHRQCSYYCQSASRDALSVYLTGPSTPPGGGTSTDLSTSVNLYLESGEVKPPWIQDGVATEAARASAALNSRWTDQSITGINGAIHWRYAAFTSGLLLNHPAVKIDQNLQFSQLPWYNRALAHPGLITLSPATSDPRQTGLLYSISKAIYIPRTPDRSTTTVGGPVLSVVAGDISVTSLRTIINSMEPLCTEKYYSCFLVDSAGMVIYHPSFLNDIPSQEPRHFATFYPAFYSHLFTQGNNIINKERCNDYSNSAVNVSERSFSMFDVQFSDVVSNNGSGACEKYLFTRVPNTNVFLAIDFAPGCSTLFFCPCRNSALLNCASCPNNEPPTCDCPCTCHLTPNSALNLRQCPTGPTEQPPSYNFEVNAPSDLGLCYDQQCETVTDQNSCNALRECTWCSTQCTRLADCCEDNQTVLLPNCVQSICRISDSVGDDDVSSGAIAGAVVGVIFVILVIGCLILVLVWYNFIRKEDPNAPKQENEFDFSKSRSSSDTQSQEPLSKKAANKTDSKVEERPDSNGANIMTPDTIQLSNPLFANDNTNNKADQPPLPETNL